MADDNLLAALAGTFEGISGTIKPFAQARFETELSEELTRRKLQQQQKYEVTKSEREFHQSKELATFEAGLKKTGEAERIKLEKEAKEEEELIPAEFLTQKQREELGKKPGEKISKSALAAFVKEEVATKKGDPKIDKAIEDTKAALTIYDGYVDKVKKFRGDKPIGAKEAAILWGRGKEAEFSGGIIEPEIHAFQKSLNLTASTYEKLRTGVGGRTIAMIKLGADAMPQYHDRDEDFNTKNEITRGQMISRLNQLQQLKKSGKTLEEEQPDTTSAPPGTSPQPGGGLNQTHFEELKGLGFK